MPKDKYRIILLLNWKNRDMRGILQLKIHLDRMAYNVRVVSHGKMPLWNIYRFRPHLIVFPQVLGEVRMVKLAKKMGCLIAVLHSEGTVSRKNVSSWFYKKDINVGEVVDLEMVWGPEWKQIYLEYTTLSANQIHVVGNPRFDIYRPPLNSLLMCKSDFCRKYGINPKKKLVIWASNFVNLEKSEADIEYVQSFVSYNVKEHLKIQRKLREKCTKTFLQVAKENSKINFMIKLHPLEIPDYYLEELSKARATNVTLFKDEDISTVVNASDLLLHTGSTSATEAGFLGKPTVCMLFELDYEEDLADFIWGSDIVEDFESLQSKINYYLYEHGEIPPEIINNRQSFNEKWFYRIDGKSTMRAANVIDAYLQEIKPPHVNRVVTDDLLSELRNRNPIITFLNQIQNFVFKRRSYWSEIRKTEVPTRKELRNLETELRELYDL